MKKDTTNPSFSNVLIERIKVRAIHYETTTTIIHYPALQFKSEVPVSIGEHSQVAKAKYQGLWFENVRSSTQSVVYICGFLLTYYNGRSNYAKLSLSELHKALYDLAGKFKLSPSTEMIKLEYGLNLKLLEEIAVDWFINNILAYKGRKSASTLMSEVGLWLSSI